MFQTIYNLASLPRQKPQRVDTALAFFQLSRMLRAGVSLSDALDDLATHQGDSRQHHSWHTIAHNVCSGNSFSEALSSSSTATDKTIIALLKAGEAGGQLDAACESIYEYLQWHHNLRQRLFTLLIYPLFSLCVLIGVTGFLFISVVPSIKGFLVSSGGELEWHTVALIDLSAWMSHHYLPALISGVAIVPCMVFALKISLRLRLVCSRCVLQLPVVGKLIIDLTLSRYAHCCAQLYASGIALEASMELAEDTILNQVITAQLSSARSAMVGGATLTESLRGVSVLPSLFTRLVAVGEKTGKLEEVLIQIGEHQNAAAEASIQRTEQLIGPLLLMLVGGMLLWIVVSVLGPVYNTAIATVVGAS